MRKRANRKRKIIKAALVYAQEIVTMRAAMMACCEMAYFKAHPEALKYKNEIMVEAEKMVPR